MTNCKTPSHYEIHAIAEHAMRRLFQASGRPWEEYGPEDAMRHEWLEQALVTEAEVAEELTSERTEWNVPKKTVLRPVAVNETRSRNPRALSDRGVEKSAEHEVERIPLERS